VAVPPSGRGRKRHARERHSLRVATALALSVAAVAAAVAARDATTHVAAPQACDTAIVSSGSIAGTLRVAGRLEVESTVRIGSSQPALVVAVSAGVGTRVAKGQVLARLDDTDARAALGDADAKLSSAQVLGIRAERRLLAEIDEQRRQGLLPESSDPPELLDGEGGDLQLEYLYNEAQISRHEALVSAARGQLARRVVRAPMDGIVLARNIQPGESISASPPGPPLFVLGSDPKRLRLDVEIDERYLTAVVPGPTTFVVPARGSQAFAGTVRQVVPLPNALRSPAPYLVVVDVANAEGALQPGMSATADLPMTTGRDALSVPVGAVSSRPDGFVVWLSDDSGRPVPTPVTVGVTSADLAEVGGPGIDAGRIVITDASPSTCTVVPPKDPFAAGAP
jgi:HlyD family secretion protein